MGKYYESKTNSLAPLDRYSAYQGRSLHTYEGFVPTRIRTRQMAHLDDFVCDIWISLASAEHCRLYDCFFFI